MCPVCGAIKDLIAPLTKEEIQKYYTSPMTPDEEVKEKDVKDDKGDVAGDVEKEEKEEKEEEKEETEEEKEKEEQKEVAKEEEQEEQEEQEKEEQEEQEEQKEDKPQVETITEEEAKEGEADYKVFGNVMVVTVPLSLLGLTADDCYIRFKVCDNVQDPGNIMSYYVTGDSAPIGRFAYSYGY